MSGHEIWADLDKNAKRLVASADVGGRFVHKNGHSAAHGVPGALRHWLADDRLDFVCNHETRFHKSDDLLRYLFVATYGEIFGKSPKLHHFPNCLLPNHSNVDKTLETRHGNFNDRFRVQLRSEPATTVTSHIAKDGHSFIHHDPVQCRSWTVREAARIQTFPDNYLFEGFRTDQYKQVGNAVPPYLAAQIAGVAASVIEQIGRHRWTF
jgi:DNA (cytosine-5)-methyltransferase 1